MLLYSLLEILLQIDETTLTTFDDRPVQISQSSAWEMPLNLEDLLYPSAAAANRVDWTQIDEKLKSASNTSAALAVCDCLVKAKIYDCDRLATNGLSTVALDQESWPPFASTSKVTLEALPDDLTVSAWLDLFVVLCMCSTHRLNGRKGLYLAKRIGIMQSSFSPHQLQTMSLRIS